MTPKTALLHIGTTKTGTTSIQTCLSRAQKYGALAPVRYPLWPGEENQWRLTTLYLPEEGLGPALGQIFNESPRRYRRMREKYRRFLFRELASARHAVLSAENLSTHFTPLHALRLREDLEALGFKNFRVVMYVRDPADYFLSSAQHRLRDTTTLPFIKDPASVRYDFRRFAETWEQVFPDSLIVRKYPKGPNEDVLEDFAGVLKQYLGVTLPRVSLRQNTTLSAEGMQVLQDYREAFWSDSGGVLTPDAVRLVSFLIGPAVKDVPQTRPVLKEPLAAIIRANHKADADDLYRRYGVDLDLGDVEMTAPSPPRGMYRVEDILQSVDPLIVDHLLLRLASTGLHGSPAERARAVAARVYRRIPPGHRPERLADWLRSRL